MALSIFAFPTADKFLFWGAEKPNETKTKTLSKRKLSNLNEFVIRAGIVWVWNIINVQGHIYTWRELH